MNGGSAATGASHDAMDPTSIAAGLFEELRARTADASGVTRAGYGAGEHEAMELVAAVAREHGLRTERDAAANLLITLPGRDSELPALLCGSHLDSVPQGGNYDGAAGVIAGLLCLLRMQAAEITPAQSVKVIVLRAEESAWFGKSYIGSSALFGLLSEADLAATQRGGDQTLAQCMRNANADVDRIGRGESLLDPATVAAYLELHIEQGPVMVARDLPTAPVTGIRGCIRHERVTCHGEPGHSGAVPRWLRRDAVFATAELIGNLDEHWQVLQERGLDLTITAGMIGTNPAEHAMTRIPGEVTFSFELRSQSIETLEAVYRLALTECRQIGATRGVEFEFDRRLLAPPARLDERWLARLQTLSEQLGLPAEPLPSGAGHDAAVFANAGVPSAMIFVRNAHGSHNPEEAMEMDDFLKGADLLYHAILDVV